MVSSPSENGYVFFWPKAKPPTKRGCLFWKDKKATNKAYEYCLPFPKNSSDRLTRQVHHRAPGS